MSFFQKLFGKPKLENDELLKKLMSRGRELGLPELILRKANSFFKEKAGELGPREFHPWIDEWHYSPQLLEFVYIHFTLEDLSQLAGQRNDKYDYYANDVMSETLIDEEKYPIEVDQFVEEYRTAYFVTALMIRDIVANSLPY
ncbi:hypothetical protein JOC77_001018 [Peribacillus deserti]|uniref:DUF3916 domain-containing protein n=1 Tax=Peribacillus deserti TaxID=673318 RepID=A0ABS2QEM9_9BACI|nr:hypothetical protein [Peribacillus deserti]MBM7691611.1 hypothetical protein [Peribacillus deserti]